LFFQEVQVKVRLLSALVALFVAAAAHATTFEPLTDRELITSADAVVVGVVGDVSSRMDGSTIVTDTQMRVDDVLKGPLVVSENITISEVGGNFGGKIMLVVDGAQYQPGERVLVFLKRSSSGSWFTRSMTMGRFEFGRNMAGDAVLIRESHGERDASRLQSSFLSYIREVAAGKKNVPEAYWSNSVAAAKKLEPASDAAPDYAILASAPGITTRPVRWDTNSVTFSKTGSQPGFTTSAVDTGAAAWTNVTTASISISTAGTTPLTDPNSLDTTASKSTLQFGYDGSVPAAAFCDSGQACTVLVLDSDVTHAFPAGTSQLWYSIQRAHIIFRTTIPNQAQFNSLAVHELGHGIGIRHSNEPGRVPNVTGAIMTSPVNTSLGQTLQQFDKDAASSLYGSGPACVTPAATIRGGGSVGQGQSATLTADATGTAPLTYQWYRGNKGDRTTPVGTNSSSFTTPAVTSSQTYWVLVSNTCGSFESNSVTVTPVACEAPVITNQPPSLQQVNAGSSVTLTVAHTGSGPFTYEWYRGTKPDTSSRQSAASNIFTTPPVTTTTSYWLRIINSCGRTDSNTFTLEVAGTCSQPSLVLAPRSQSIPSARAIALVASSTGAPITYRWYRGSIPDTSAPQTSRDSADNDRWLATVFADLLRRPIDSANAAAFSAQLGAGASRNTVARAILASDEYRAAFIAGLYETFFRRSPNDTESDFWVAALRSGTPEETVIASILASPEYFAVAGGTPTSWIGLLHNDLLGRAPNSGELSGFLGALSAGTPRQSVARAILTSTEGRTRAIAQLYQRLLRRDPTASEVSAQIGTVAEGSYIPAIASLVASDEYFTFGSVLIINSAASTASYWVEAFNTCGNVRGSATVTVNQCVVPAIVAQPANTTVDIGAPFTLGFALNGSPATSIQWYEGERGDASRPVSGANAALFTGTRTAAGTYRFWARASNACGAIDTNSAVVTVNCGVQAPQITANVASVLKNNGFRIRYTPVSGVTYAFRGTNATATLCAANEFCVTPTPGFVGVVSATVDATINCPSGVQTKSSTIDVSVNDVDPPSAPQFSLATPPCASSSCRVVQKLFISGDAPAAGKAAQAVTTFSLSADRPWISFNPQTGILPPAGITVDVISETAGLEPGTTTGATVTVTKTTTDSSMVGIAATTTTPIPLTVSLVQPVSPLPKGANPPPNSLIIPAVANADGANLSKFVSDVRIVNNSSVVQNYLLSFTPAGTNGTTSGRQFSLSINPNDSKALDNVVKNWFGLGTGSVSGAMEIRPVSNSTTIGGGAPSNQLVTVASSRTYNSTPLGTFGQYVPALPLSSFLSKLDSKISLQQITQSSSANSFRTNIGLVEGSGEVANIELRLLNASNQEIAKTTRTLQPFEQVQLGIPALFNNATVTNGRVEIRVLSDTGKVTGYASVLDNTTSDPILILPVRPGALQGRRYVVPGVAEFEFDAKRNFRTDLRIFNGGTTAETLTINYSTSDRTPPAPVQMTIAPGEVKVIDDTLRSLWGISNSGGAVVITSSDESSLVVTGRTFTRSSTGGTFGQFIPGVTPEEAAGNGARPLQVLQMEQSPNFRSNLGLVEVTGQPATVRVRYFSADSKTSGSLLDFTMQPGEFRQLGFILQPLGTVYNGRVTVQVIGGSGRVAAYGANIDNRTADPTYIPAQ
jgi:hypothetical protein